MKVSRQQAEENRKRVVEVASALFRSHGFDGVSVADVMKGAGLTHGGFYANFASKDELAIEAIGDGLNRSRQHLLDIADGTADPLAALVRFYLSADHRDHPEAGCPIAALVSEAGRRDDSLRKAFERGIIGYLQILEGLVAATDDQDRHGRALATLSTLVGALILARAVADPEFSNEILASAAQSLLN